MTGDLQISTTVSRSRGVRAKFRDPLVIGVFATAISGIGAGNPSFWYDEAATISATNRSLQDLVKLIATSDAAHPFYYFLMHTWFAVFPRTEFWARAPSLVAVGIAAAGVVVLARQLSTRVVAVAAGAVFAVLPRVTWAAIEARPYALTCVVSVWLTIMLIVAARRRTAPWWFLYMVMFVFAVALNIYLTLLILVHLCALMALRATRSTFIAWSISTGVTVALLIPYLVFLQSQVGELDWIEPLDIRTFGYVFGTQYFDRSVPFAILAVAGTCVSVGISSFRHRWTEIEGYRGIVLIAIAWVAIPTAIILIVSATVRPLYADRYLSFTAPATALLLGLTVVMIGRKPAGIALLVAAFAMSAVPNYIWQRSDYAKVKMDYSKVADLIEAQAHPGDCLLLDDTVDWRPGPIRPLLHARPGAYRELVDVGLGESAVSAGKLWDGNLAPFQVVDRIARCSVLWTITEREPELPPHELGVALPPGPHFVKANAFWVPRELGFRLVERWQFNISQVIKAVR
jgi:mannosyltransferase